MRKYNNDLYDLSMPGQIVVIFYYDLHILELYPSNDGYCFVEKEMYKQGFMYYEGVVFLCEYLC